MKRIQKSFYLRLLVILAVASMTVSVVAQELHDWKSNSGHTTKAALLKINEANRKVTLLIPREIDFDTLAPESLALARKLVSDAFVTSGTNAERQGQVEQLDSAATPPSKQAIRVTEPDTTSEMRFLRAKYDALSHFKLKRDFAEWGFSIGGPYGTWLKDVEGAKNANLFKSKDIGFATAHLLTLGLEYKDSKGKETEYANFANACIRGILAGQSKDEFEKIAIKKIETIITEKSRPQVLLPAQMQGNSPSKGEYKYVEDDVYPDIYAFRTADQLKNYWNGEQENANLSARERINFGIELIESRTKILIVSRMPFQTATIYEVEATAGRQKGKRLFVISFDVYDNLR